MVSHFGHFVFISLMKLTNNAVMHMARYRQPFMAILTYKHGP